MEKLPIRVLIADDEKNIRELLRDELASTMTHVAAAESGSAALAELERSDYDILLLDLTMPVMDGMEVLKRLKSLDISAEVIILTANATVLTAVEAMKLGAYDYLMKPFKIVELIPIIEKAYEKKKLRSENILLRTQVKKQSEVPTLIAESQVMRDVIERAKNFAPSDFPVLITGESGTGKELIARIIHNESARTDRSYVIINCGALPENMIESELFGYEKGAFTKAQWNKYYSKRRRVMKKLVMIGMAVLVMFGFAGNGFAAEKRGTAAEAEKNVKKAIAMAKAKGKDATFAEINNPKGQFTDRDLYVFVYDMSGKVMAHGQNLKMIGKELIDMKDADGKEFVKERVEIAKTKGSGWQEYKFTDPLTKLIDQKRAYVERYEDLIFGSGIYK